MSVSRDIVCRVISHETDKRKLVFNKTTPFHYFSICEPVEFLLSSKKIVLFTTCPCIVQSKFKFKSSLSFDIGPLSVRIGSAKADSIIEQFWNSKYFERGAEESAKDNIIDEK